jgi:hypothetical protein
VRRRGEEGLRSVGGHGGLRRCRFWEKP